MNNNPTVEVCFSPKLYEHKLTKGKFVTVVVDILRATTSICAAFDNGIKDIIPVSSLEEAKSMKQQGYLVACERDGIIMDFADIGNSASDFVHEYLQGQSVVFSTTNGTKTINMARDANEVLIGSFVNIQSLADYLLKKNENIVIFCAAWKNLFNLEDSVFAGALSKILIDGGYATFCDASLAAIDLWSQAKSDLKKYLTKSSHRNRLAHLVSDDDYVYTVTLNSSKVIPLLNGNKIVPM